jgi:hypothetical protein
LLLGAGKVEEPQHQGSCAITDQAEQGTPASKFDLGDLDCSLDQGFLASL